MLPTRTISGCNALVVDAYAVEAAELYWPHLSPPLVAAVVGSDPTAPKQAMAGVLLSVGISGYTVKRLLYNSNVVTH